MGSTKNAKKDKVEKSKKAVRDIQNKQSQKKRINILKKREKQRRIKEKEKRRKEREQEKKEKIKKDIITKQEEREAFIASFPETGKVINHNARVDAELADEKRRQAYMKYVQLR